MKKLVVIAGLFAVMTVAVYAQGMALSGWESPQSAATQGRIRSAADDFIRPDSYTSAGVKDWFGMASFSSTSAANIGYAKKTENLYFAAYYGGSFWANLTPFNYTERNVGDWPGGSKTVKIYNGLDFSAPAPSNRVSLLLGLADMGFRLSFYSTHEAFSGSDIRDLSTTTDYKSYEADKGIIAPQLAWSMAKNLAGNGIKPYLTIDLNFQRDYVKYEQAGGASGAAIGTSANYLEPIIMLGLGGYTLVNKDGFRGSADLEYRLTLRLYDNEYSVLDSSGNKIWKISGLNNSVGLSEKSYTVNWLRPSFSGQWSNGPISLRLKLDLNMTLTNEDTTGMIHSVDKLVKNGNDTTSTTFAFNPDFRLAMQWKLIPKLALNAGGRVNVTAVSVKTDESKSYLLGNETANSSAKAVTNTYGATAVSLTTGVTFNPADYLTLEAACGIGTANSVSVFNDTTGLFNFYNILVSLKF